MNLTNAPLNLGEGDFFERSRSPCVWKASTPKERSTSEEIEGWSELFGRAAWTRIVEKETHRIEGGGIDPWVLCWVGVDSDQTVYIWRGWSKLRQWRPSLQTGAHTHGQDTHGTKTRQGVTGSYTWDACASVQAVRPQRFADKFTQIPANTIGEHTRLCMITLPHRRRTHTISHTLRSYTKFTLFYTLLFPLFVFPPSDV